VGDKIKFCPICEGDQHVVDETETTIFLGCSHTIDKSEPDGEPAELETEPEGSPDGFSVPVLTSD